MQLHKELRESRFTLAWCSLKHDNRSCCHKVWI